MLHLFHLIKNNNNNNESHFFTNQRRYNKKIITSIETANFICDLMYSGEIKDLADCTSNQHRFMSAGKQIVVVSEKKTVIVILNGSL